jgi:hypothetical protein
MVRAEGVAQLSNTSALRALTPAKRPKPGHCPITAISGAALTFATATARRRMSPHTINAQHRTAAQAARSPSCALAGMRWDYREATKMKEATNVTKPMREAAKEAETALRLANEIVERILHEGVHDNPTVIAAVMLALTQNFNAISIRDALDDVASAVRESTLH